MFLMALVRFGSVPFKKVRCRDVGSVRTIPKEVTVAPPGPREVRLKAGGFWKVN